MNAPSIIDRLIDALRCMPGIGPKSAQRIAYHLIERNREGARKLATTMLEAIDIIGNCQRCRNISEQPVCALCANPIRDRTLLCIVENPADVKSIEQSADFKGLYFVLMGRLSPLDGIGPEEIGIDRLTNLLDAGEVQEVILATSTTVEGQATAHYIGEIVRSKSIRVTRIAHGIPLGGELEYVDSSTLSHAINSRREL